LLKEFTQTLYATADNVYMNVRFNPHHVKEYKLIGFDNKVGALKDTLSSIEGGEAGSGQAMMTVFEVVPAEKNTGSDTGSYADVELNYNLPGKPAVQMQFSHSCAYRLIPFSELRPSYRFSSAVVMLGLLLKQSPLTKAINWTEVNTIAVQSATPGNLPQQEFIALVQQARGIYLKKRKKKESTAEY
jgi:Ca-activated chloride channel family protein